ncbi:MAG: hypothetical protein QW776_04825 [Candidatus Nitrosocaldus sp.]
MMFANELERLRKKLYRLYDIENMKGYDSILSLHQTMKRYSITTLTLEEFKRVKGIIEEALSKAKSFDERNRLVRDLDNMLTLIAIADNRNALKKVIITNELIEEGLFNGDIKENIIKMKAEVEGKIIDAKRRLYNNER